MTSAIASPTPAPIHDIVGPLWIFPYPLWVIVTVALAGLALLGLVFWLTRRKRALAPQTPRQRALAALEELRGGVSESDSYGFGVKVSDCLRTYIRDQHGLDAITRTSLEFLEALRDHPAFSSGEKAALSEFLESVDLLKYARLPAAADDLRSLLSIGERLVKRESPDRAGALK
jgi:hypothetical protein